MKMRSDNLKMNLSFAGCGFLGIYHVGVAVCFRKYAPHLLLNKISGASAGALAACCLLCDLPLGDLTSDALRLASEARTPLLGPFSPSFKVQTVLLQGLEKFLPEDAHIRVSGKLHISLTRVHDGQNVIVSKFYSRDDLIQALLASAFIPFFSGFIPPSFRGVRYMDGGLSDNLPTLDENTITVSPFCGESDICPRDESSQLFHINFANTSIELSKQNLYRLARIVFPAQPEKMSHMCKQGFDDALRFLHRNDLISCTRCLSVQSTFIVSEKVNEPFEHDPHCDDCKTHRQEALVSKLPETVLTVFQNAIQTTNNGIVNWVFRYRNMKLLSILTLPYVLPADIVAVTFTKFKSVAPKMGNNLWEMSKFLMEQLTSLIQRARSQKDDLTSKISCQLKMTEYSGSKYDNESNKNIPLAVKNKVNLNFTMNLDESNGNEELPNELHTHDVRRPSVTYKETEISVDDDTFERILQVTSHHESVMAYYYLDENNKVKVTEIFDVTDAECDIMQSLNEKEANTQLEFDNEWENTTWLTESQEDEYIIDESVSDKEIQFEKIIETESKIIDDDFENQMTNILITDTSVPESDQINYNLIHKQIKIPSSVILDTK